MFHDLGVVGMMKETLASCVAEWFLLPLFELLLLSQSPPAEVFKLFWLAGGILGRVIPRLCKTSLAFNAFTIAQ